MNKLLALIVCVSAVVALHAQDSRERHYFYEILDPKHEPKPLVEGFAKARVTERLNRGLYAAPARDGKGVYLSWRLLNTDAPSTAFHVYRETDGKTRRLTSKPVSLTCDFTDTAPVKGKAAYWVVPVVKSAAPVANEKVVVEAGQLAAYTSIRLKDNVKAGKIALADLNGDGTYDYIIRTPETNIDPGMPGDTTGTTYKISAYLSDGTWLWTYDMGRGIEPGIWYSPFIVYDFNGDGKAEVAIKSAGADFIKNEKGRVCGGSEYLSVLDGMTGKEIDRVDWPERNDRYGNLIRQNRNQMGVAYLDGKTPCILAARGTYKLMVVDAWQLKDGKLQRLWRWDGDEENPLVRSMGAHSMVTGDVDGDGRDEVMLGSCMLDDNGTLLWSSGLGHSDKAYLCKLHPDSEGMQVFMVSEPKKDDGRGVSVVDARTGKLIWGIGQTTYHVGDGMVADFDPEHPGLECFASEDRKGGSTDKYLLTADGRKLNTTSEEVPGCRNWIWWDGDLLRETFRGDDNRWGAGSSSNGKKQSIWKWQGETLTEGIEGDILIMADIEGDWREELITALPGELRIYRTSIPAKDRRVTLMQDPLYRSYVAHRSMGYPQAPVPSYYLGESAGRRNQIGCAVPSYKYQSIFKNLPFAMPEVRAPQFPDRKACLTDFGAVGDGVTLCTEAFSKAINALSGKGGGHLVVPAGIWFTGPIVLKSNIDLHLEKGAVILFSPDVDLYPLVETVFEGLDTRRCQSPISGRNLTNVAITGQGAIDGNGHYWRPLKREKVTESVWEETIARGGVYKRPTYWFPYPETLKGDTISDMNVPRNLKTEAEWQSVRHFLRPVMVSLMECRKVWLQGVIFQNSPAWNLHPLMCENVLIEEVQVRNPSYAQNGDGLDLESCRNALIVNSTFDVGDDGICLKSGKDEDGRRRARPCENVVVDGCTVFKGHGGFVVGSEMSGGVRNVSVSNCKFLGTDVGLRFKSKRGRGGVVENIWIKDVAMTDIPTEPVTFNLYYGGKSAVEVLESGEGLPVKVAPLPVDETTPCFRNIHISNLTCSNARRAMYFNGIPEMPINGITLENIRVKARLGAEFNYCRNIKQKDVQIEIIK